MVKDMLNLVRPALREISAYQVPRIEGIEVKLDANESPYGLPKEDQIALLAHLSSLDVNRYPDPEQGELRELIADEYGVSKASLLFGNGSDEIIAILIACLAAPRPGQSQSCIVYPTPTFSVFNLFAIAQGVQSYGVPTRSDFTLDLAAMHQALTEHRPNIAFFARPNNPTGTLWRGSDLLNLAEKHPKTLFVSDEAYGEYSTDSLVSALPNVPNLLVMKTLSKIGLAGFRIGFAIADEQLIAQLNKVRAPYNISSLNQHAASFAMRHCRETLRNQCRAVVKERERVREALRGYSELYVFSSSANLILFRVGQRGGGDGQKLWQHLCDAGVLIRCFGNAHNPDGVPNALADCLRVTIGTVSENNRFLHSLADGLPATA